ncbi:MAG: hypothetical protein H0U65_07495 [Rubrobacter sp.]|nr:hypothetical protein [Rubrobacter sp.]
MAGRRRRQAPPEIRVEKNIAGGEEGGHREEEVSRGGASTASENDGREEGRVRFHRLDR